MKYEHWQIPAAPEDAIKTLMDAGYPYLVSSVLAARGDSGTAPLVPVRLSTGTAPEGAALTLVMLTLALRPL